MNRKAAGLILALLQGGSAQEEVAAEDGVKYCQNREYGVCQDDFTETKLAPLIEKPTPWDTSEEIQIGDLKGTVLTGSSDDLEFEVLRNIISPADAEAMRKALPRLKDWEDWESIYTVGVDGFFDRTDKPHQMHMYSEVKNQTDLLPGPDGKFVYGATDEKLIKIVEPYVTKLTAWFNEKVGCKTCIPCRAGFRRYAIKERRTVPPYRSGRFQLSVQLNPEKSKGGYFVPPERGSPGFKFYEMQKGDAMLIPPGMHLGLKILSGNRFQFLVEWLPKDECVAFADVQNHWKEWDTTGDGGLNRDEFRLFATARNKTTLAHRNEGWKFDFNRDTLFEPHEALALTRNLWPVIPPGNHHFVMADESPKALREEQPMYVAPQDSVVAMLDMKRRHPWVQWRRYSEKVRPKVNDNKGPGADGRKEDSNKEVTEGRKAESEDKAQAQLDALASGELESR